MGGRVEFDVLKLHADLLKAWGPTNLRLRRFSRGEKGKR